MVQHLLNADFKKLRSFFAKFFSMPDRDGFVLLLRLENIPLLTDRLRQSGITHLMKQLLIRLGTGIRSDDPVQAIAPGIFTVSLRNKSASDAMAIAVRMQGYGQQPIAASGHKVTPVLTGLLLHDDQARFADQADLIYHGCEKLAELKPCQLGQISMVHLQSSLSALPLPVSVAQAAQMGQICAYFQPKLCCHTGSVTGFEVLARWLHATKGVLLPAEFTPGMTDADHHALTKTMLEQALQAIPSWQAAGYDIPTVSINISVGELNKPGFADRVLHELSLHKLPPSALIIELSESIGPINTNASAHANLKSLSAAGCQLDLDDFGIGYAGLDAIRSFGAKRIKINRSFVTGCQNDPERERMILGIFALAENLGISTITVGVETPEEHSFLAQIGSSEVQGFAISRPMPFNETFAFLKNRKSRQQELPNIPLRKNDEY